MEGEIERVLVAGASGRTGRELLWELAHTDCVVRGMTTSERKRDDLREWGADEVVVGDLLEPADAARAVEGCDAVLCSVGTRPGLGALVGDLVDDRGVKNLVNAAVAASVERFVLESSIGVGDSWEMVPAPFRWTILPVLAAKNRAEAALRTSGLDYTIVRPGGLTGGPPTCDVVVGEGGATVTGSIPRADVAWVMVAALFTPSASKRTFEVVSRHGQRGTARGTVEVDWQYRRPEKPVERDLPGRDEPVRIEVEAEGESGEGDGEEAER